jgi:uncharacterized protein (DUF1330 family)
MPVYFIAQIDIHDQAGYDKYAEQAGPSMVGIDAKPLAIDDHPVPLEGNWVGPRTVMLEFPDEAAFRKWYDSPAYQAAAKLRKAATTSNAILLHGLG